MICIYSFVACECCDPCFIFVQTCSTLAYILYSKEILFIYNLYFIFSTLSYTLIIKVVSSKITQTADPIVLKFSYKFSIGVGEVLVFLTWETLIYLYSLMTTSLINGSKRSCKPLTYLAFLQSEAFRGPGNFYLVEGYLQSESVTLTKVLV